MPFPCLRFDLPPSKGYTIAHRFIKNQKEPIRGFGIIAWNGNARRWNHYILRSFLLGRYDRADSRFAPSQWETSLQSNAVSHWLVANLESAMYEIVSWRYASGYLMWKCGLFTVVLSNLTLLLSNRNNASPVYLVSAMLVNLWHITKIRVHAIPCYYKWPSYSRASVTSYFNMMILN